MDNLKKLLLILSLLLLVSCEKHLESGVVISKKYVPEHHYIYMMPIPHTTMIGKTMVTNYTYVPVPTTNPEKFLIVVSGKVKTETVVETVNVGENKFNHLNIGDTLIIVRK